MLKLQRCTIVHYVYAQGLNVLKLDEKLEDTWNFSLLRELPNEVTIFRRRLVSFSSGSSG